MSEISEKKNISKMPPSESPTDEPGIAGVCLTYKDAAFTGTLRHSLAPREAYDNNGVLKFDRTQVP
jgi:hypothetical protein